MVGWWRLLLLYGIAINLGIDESISTASGINGSNTSVRNGSKASDLNGSNASDLNGSNVSDMNGSNVSDMNGSNVSDMNGSNASGVNGTKASGLNGSNASDLNGSNASGVNGTKASDLNGSNASDLNGSNASGVNGTKASDLNGSNASDLNGSNVSDMNGSNVSDMNGSNVSDMNGYNVSDMNGSNVSDMNGSNVSDMNGSNASGVNGTKASGLNGSNASDLNGSNASGVNGTKASDLNGSNASDLNGSNASGVNGTKASDLNGSNASDLNGSNVSDMNGSNVSDMNGSNVSDMNGSNVSDMNGSNVSDMNGSNVSDMNGSNVSDMNGSNVSDMNGSNVSDMNGSNVSDMNGSNVSDMNGSNVSDMNDSNVSDMNGSNVSDMNSSTVEDMNGSNVSDMNGSNVSDMNGSTVEDENVVARRVRQKRQSHSTAFPVLFATTLVKAVAIRWGKRVVNTSADHFLGGELGDFKFFAGDYACSVKCDCGWGNCVPSYEATPGDSCCVTNYKLECCEPPEFSDGNPTKLEAVGQKLCLKTPISCRIDSTELCHFERPAILIKNPTNISLKHFRGFVDENCEASHFRMAFYGRKNYYDDYTLIVQPCYFLENREGCPMCGWELCIVRTERLSCSCCAYDNLAFCRWQTSPGCTYLPDDKLAEDSPKCPDCKWKMSYSDDDKKFQCCHRLTLHECTRVPATRAFVKSDDPLNKSTLVNANAECKDLVDDQCHCGWGSCFPREGRAAGECCDKHHDLVCCEGRRRLELNGSNTKAEISKVFLMLLVMRLAGPNASGEKGPNASGGNGSNASGGNDSTALAVIDSNANEISLVNLRQKREPFTLTVLAITFVTALVTSVATAAGEKAVDAIAGIGSGGGEGRGVETGARQVFSGGSTKRCDETCNQCGWGNCLANYGRGSDDCCTANYQWECCRTSQAVHDESPTKLCFKSRPLCWPPSCEGDQKFYFIEKEKNKNNANGTLKIEETRSEKQDCDHTRASMRGDFFSFDETDPNNVKDAPSAAGKYACQENTALFARAVTIRHLELAAGAGPRNAFTNRTSYPNHILIATIVVGKCAIQTRNLPVVTSKRLKTGLGIAANAPLLMQANVNKNDECQKLMEAQCDCKWGSCFPRMGRAASKCCTDNYDLVCCKGSNKADKSNGNASSIIAFFMTIAQLVVGRILT
uniref:Uncharacterized protein n=1 Tax=Globodera rostochiensis TaxID=31243 RepID=A0A914H6H1_GLORO